MAAYFKKTFFGLMTLTLALRVQCCYTSRADPGHAATGNQNGAVFL